MDVLATVTAFIAMFALLLAAAVEDIKCRLIPNVIVAAIVAVWVILQVALVGFAWAQGDGSQAAVRMADAAGLLLSALVFLAFAIVFTLVAERVSGRYMFGGGDIKLLSALVLYLGIPTMLVALFAACFVSFAYALAPKVQAAWDVRKARGSQGARKMCELRGLQEVRRPISASIPFAPCMACGTLASVLFI